MPLDPILTQRRHLLEGLTTDDVLGDDPAAWERLVAFGAPVDGYSAPPVECTDRRVAGPHGDVGIRVYGQAPPDPTGGVPNRPGLVWIHGGAFVSGDLDMPEADTVSRELVDRADAVVVSVDYRLAVNGVHFPVPLDDVLAAWTWTWHNAGELGIDPDRLFIGGASAGGCLAASAAVRLRNDHRPAPAGVLLAYPLVHRVLPEPSPDLARCMSEIPAVLGFPPDLVRHFNDNYLGPDSDRAAEAFVGLGPVAAFPRTVIITSEYDDLRSSGEAFGAALADAGVEVTVHCEPGVPHGHLNTAGLPGAIRSLDRFARFLV